MHETQYRAVPNREKIKVIQIPIVSINLGLTERIPMKPTSADGVGGFVDIKVTLL